MPNPILQIYLPAFLIAFLFLIFGWKIFTWIFRIIRRLHSGELSPRVPSRIPQFDVFYKLVMGFFVFMIASYSFFPKWYQFFVPLPDFDHPVINGIGLFLLKLSVVIIVIAQIVLGSQSSEGKERGGEIIVQEKIFHAGAVIMFVGSVTTITNFVGLLIALLSILYFLKPFQTAHSA